MEGEVAGTEEKQETLQEWAAKCTRKEVQGGRRAAEAHGGERP